MILLILVLKRTDILFKKLGLLTIPFILQVDVGSALACDRGDGRYTLAGIYSWDTGCNPTAQIAGYTKIDTQWIESTIQRPVKDLRTEEKGFYAQLQGSASGRECHCIQEK